MSFCIQGEKIYQAGLVQLNKSQGDKALGYKLMNEAAEKGHKGAMVKLAWAKLFGSLTDQNITEAIEVFENLAAVGNADAHTVCECLLNIPIL